MVMDAGKIRVGLIQMTCEREPRLNLEKAAARIEQAAARGAQVVCLQELYRSWYPCQAEENGNFDLAEPVPGPSTETLGRVAAARKVAVIVPIFERRAAGIYHNSAIVIDEQGRIAGHYRKMHIPDDPGYYEKFYFTPGDLDFLAHRTDGREPGRADLLGSVVSRGGTADGDGRGADSLLPDRNRMDRRDVRRRSAASCIRRGKRFSARMRSPTGSSSRRSIG